MAYPFVSLQGAAPPVERRWIPGGDLGTYATVAAMTQAANRALTTPRVVQTAARIVRAVNVRDPVQVWRALRQWLVAHFQFVPDPLDVETIRTPLEQLRQIDERGVMLGDCDDAATLIAALAKAVGQRVRFVVLGFKTATAPYQHVYAEMATPDGWADFDITRTAGAPTPTRAAVQEV
jgi:transglutaminase-like putative cysteine protease